MLPLETFLFAFDHFFVNSEKDCGEPASLQDGEKIGSNFRYGGRVSFRCNTVSLNNQ